MGPVLDTNSTSGYREYSSIATSTCYPLGSSPQKSMSTCCHCCGLEFLALLYLLLDHGVKVGEPGFTPKKLLALDCFLVAFVCNVNTFVSQ